MRWEAQGVLELRLEPVDGPTLPAWDPGAHIDIEVSGGFVRQYSLCGDPSNPGEYRVAVLRDPASRGGSEFIHSALRPGQILVGRGPRNHFGLLPADSYLFIAGGIGITPLIPMVASAERVGVPWRLFYGARTRAAMAFTTELLAYGAKVEFWPQDGSGLLPLDDLLARSDQTTKVYCCGPESLLAAVEARCKNWPQDSLHTERFSPRAADSPSARRSFEVYCKASDVVVEVGPDCSILQALEAAGVHVARSCEEGICGSCETRILAGIPDHRDSVLTERERQQNASMLICVSRCLSERLVLDC